MRSVPVVQVDEPATAALVVAVLPHGLDSFFEQRVVTAGLQFGCHLDMIVHGPKVLDGVEGNHLEESNSIFKLIYILRET